jgi:Fe-S oxidoreductase
VELIYSQDVCAKCETIECLTRCQYMDFDLEAARTERSRLLHGAESRVLTDCVTCYACEEYCPYENHPFYRIVALQEEKEIWPIPRPITHLQLRMMEPPGLITPQKMQSPIVNLCAFNMLQDSVKGKLFEGVSTFGGNDVFCNLMWLHFAKSSVILERLPKMIDNMVQFYLQDSDRDEFICFHDECYGAYTHLAPAYGLEVPFKVTHLFEYLTRRLDILKERLRPLQVKVAYQRPCSNRLIPETQHWVDDIFEKIGAERVEREYDRENALCCGGVLQLRQNEELVEDIQNRNLTDMVNAGAQYCVFNCQFCFFTLSSAVTERGLTPILMSDLCRLALGE